MIKPVGIKVISNKEEETFVEEKMEIINDNANTFIPETFTHLHVHSHFSILDGMSKVPDLIEKCTKNNMFSMALSLLD